MIYMTDYSEFTAYILNSNCSTILNSENNQYASSSIANKLQETRPGIKIGEIFCGPTPQDIISGPDEEIVESIFLEFLALSEASFFSQ